MSELMAEFLGACPLCGGRINTFQGPNNHTMGTCDVCRLSFVVPATAWNVARDRDRDQADSRGLRRLRRRHHHTKSGGIRQTRFPELCPGCRQPSGVPHRAAIISDLPAMIRITVQCRRCTHEWIVHKEFAEEKPTGET